MDSFELNKIIGALLGVVFVVFSVSLISDAVFHEEAPEKPGYAIQAAEDAGGGGGEEKAGVEDITALLVDADPAKGEAIFKRCAACHTDDKSGANKVGPNLWGVVERPIASHEGFNYSSAIKDFSKGGEEKWTYDHLNHFIAGPKKYISGTAMGFAGLPKAEDRANVIAYLRTQADEQVALPSAEDVAKAKAEAEKAKSDAGGDKGAKAEGGGDDIAAALAKADPAKGEAIFKRCAACHTDDKSGANKVGPNLWGVIERPVASHEGFSYSSAMKKFSEDGSKKWTYENINTFITNPKKDVPGTAMGFAGLPKLEDRANVISYLRTQADEQVPLPGAGDDAKAEDKGDAAKADDAKAGDAKAGEAAKSDDKATDTGEKSGEAKPAEENAPATDAAKTEPGTSGDAAAKPDASTGDEPAATAPADAEKDGSADTDATPRKQDDGPADNQ